MGALLVLFFGMTVYSLVGHWLEIEMSREILSGSPVSLDRVLDSIDRHRLTRIVRLSIWGLTCVGFLFYVARVVSSARGTGARYMKMSPGGAVGSFFLPIYNFIGPYLAMQEAWRATAPDDEIPESDSEDGLSDNSDNWKLAPPSTLIRVWWFLWLASRLVAVLTNGSDETIALVIEAHRMQMYSNGLDLILTAIALLMIKEVRNRTELKWWGVHGGGAVPSARVRTLEVNNA